MTKTTEVKKQVLVRLKLKTYESLLLESTQETVKRGIPVSVPALITEKIERDQAEKKGAFNG